MTKNHLPDNHAKIENNTGILLINLGTPDHYDYFSIRQYLKEFLSDRRVIEANRFLWAVILHFFILTIRPFFIGKKYKEIWHNETNESPLKYYTRMQAKKLQDKMQNPNVVIDYAMRYGNPSIQDKINSLLSKGCRKILFVPLYPQYCAATTATVCDEIYRVMSLLRWPPQINIIEPYGSEILYIKSLVQSVKNHIETISWQPDAILSSYHGIPKEYFDKGDPYPCFCYKTNRLFNEELKAQNINITNHISFQSRFGPKEWVQPYTSDVLQELRDNNVKNLLVITPGFAADCIETLEEVNIEYKNQFLELGGENFSLVPCLNHQDHSIELLEYLVSKYI